MDQDFAILSPEKTIITYRLAGLGSRVGAHIVDLMLMMGLVFCLVIALGTASTFAPGLASGAILFLMFAAPFAYFILTEGLMNGQTLGKRMFRVRVRMADGSPITFPAALGRNLMRPADMLPGPYLFGLVAIFTNPRSQRLGDMISNTIVVQERRPGQIVIAAPHTVGIHPLEYMVGELRDMSIEEYHALRRYCDRFPELTPETQARLTDEFWVPMAMRLGVPLPPDVHPIYLAEATVMKYGRQRGVI